METVKVVSSRRRLKHTEGNPRYIFCKIKGFTLLEALVALSVLALTFATALALQGDLMGAAGANRVRSTAIGLAESKLEELRSLPFSDPALVVASYADVQQVETFTIFSASNPLDLHRCWSITPRGDLKVISVAVARTAAACQPQGGADNLVALRSLLAENDVLLAARNANLNPLRNPDGWGRLDRVDPEDYSDVPADDAGFRRITLDGNVLAIMSPDGTVLVPSFEDDVQRFATINGNIFLSGRSCNLSSGQSVAESCGLRFFTEGNILCEMYVPDGDDTLAVISGSSAGVQDFHILAYRCVAANQWRRSIALFPMTNPEEKVCVGHPGLLSNPDDPNDELKSFIRFYDGREEERVDNVVVSTLPHGLAGEDIESERLAQIGSVCDYDDALCGSDPIVKALIPGGHHFLVMNNSLGSCSARMRDFAAIDLETGSLYESLLARNPPLLACTSEKSYRGEFCISTTRVSGFIENRAALNGREFLVRSFGSQLGQSCTHAGPFQSGNGVFNCAFWNSATDTARVIGSPESAFDGDITFTEDGEFPFLSYRQDVLNRQLVIARAPVPEQPGDGDDDTLTPPDGSDTCNISVSGRRPRGNIRDITWALGTSSGGCGISGNNYSCNIPNVGQGSTIIVRAGNDSRGETVSCLAPNITINFR
jgi:Tfp pilus assembly protein PilV